jgi:NDP-hexose-3-ketoreductase
MMNILIIGFSTIFKNRLASALNECEYITKIDIASNSKVEQKLPFEKVRKFYTSYEDALKFTDASIVYISVVNSEHAQLIKKCLKLGFHVLVDKPAVLNYNDALEIVELAIKKNKMISEAIVYSYHPQIAKIKELFQKNKCAIKHITAHFTIPGLDINNFRYNSYLGGGAIYDLGPYAMGVGYDFFGEEPISCKGIRNFGSTDVDTSFSIMVEYPEKKSMIGYFGFESEYLNGVSFFGSDLSVHCERFFTIPANFENELIIRQSNKIRYETTTFSDNFKVYFDHICNEIINKSFLNERSKFLRNAKSLDILTKI